jgi:hypothetical protein
MGARLIVALFGALVVGLLGAAITSNMHEESATAHIKGLKYGGVVVISSSASNHSKKVEHRPHSILGFALVGAAPAAEQVSASGSTVAEIISITRPFTETLKQSGEVNETDIALPSRKPKIRAKPRHHSTYQKRTQPVWARLPWIR